MKIAILGANGFIGSYLCTYFWTKNYTVLPITRKTLDLTKFVDVIAWIAKERPDVIINSAISGGGLTVNDVNYSDAHSNLSIFFNFFNSHLHFRYINIGSGAEFDRTKSIDNVHEAHIKATNPKDSYGFSKNLISRSVLNKDNFYTLRLFGCFGSNEPDIRLFKKFLAGKITLLQDKYFDYFSLKDFANVVEYYCVSPELELIKDVNCVYKDKLRLSQILSRLSQIKKIDMPVKTDGKLYNSYTGSCIEIEKLKKQKGFPLLEGLDKGLENYA